MILSYIVQVTWKNSFLWDTAKWPNWESNTFFAEYMQHKKNGKIKYMEIFVQIW